MSRVFSRHGVDVLDVGMDVKGGTQVTDCKLSVVDIVGNLLVRKTKLLALKEQVPGEVLRGEEGGREGIAMCTCGGEGSRS